MKDQAEKLRQMALNIRNQIESEFNNKIFNSRVIVIASGKGGVGKTTLALNLALSLCAMNKKVLLMDADLGLANIDIMLGITPNYNLYHVIQGVKTLKEIVITVQGGLRIIPGGSGLNEVANLKENDLKRLLIQLNSLDNEYDFMIVDTGAGISNNVLSFVLSADDAVIITTPEPTSLTDAYGVVKSAVKYGFNGNTYIVINKVNNEAEGLIVGEKFRLVSEKFLDLKVESLGHIVKDPDIEEAIKKQKAFITINPTSLAAKNINNIARKLANEEQLQENNIQNKNIGIKNFFKRLAGINK